LGFLDFSYELWQYLVVYFSASCSPKSRADEHSFITRLRLAAVDVASAVLRRLARTIPMYWAAVVIFGHKFPQEVGSWWPLVERLWPFGVDLLCYVMLQMLVFIETLWGKRVGLMTAVVVLAACVERRRQRQPFWLHVEDFDVSFHISHQSTWSHRLPMSITSFMLTRLVANMNGNMNGNMNAFGGEMLRRN
jgi:hypothetical protein